MSQVRSTGVLGFAAEHLEARLCLSASVVEGVLVVEGTLNPDNIRVAGSGDTIVVRDADGVFVFAGDTVEEVLVRAGNGSDRVRLTRLDVPATVDGGPGRDVLIGGVQDDWFMGGDGDDRLRGGGGDDELFGEAGDDRISGGFGDDDLSGGPGFDRLSGGIGLDFAADTGSDLLGDALLSVEDVPNLDNVPTSPDSLLVEPLLKPFDTSLFFGSPLFGDRLIGDRIPADPLVTDPTLRLSLGDPRFGLDSSLSTPFLFPDLFSTTADLSGVTPVAGQNLADARLPGFKPIDQPIVFPGYTAFPESSFVAVLPLQTTSGLTIRSQFTNDNFVTLTQSDFHDSSFGSGTFAFSGI